MFRTKICGVTNVDDALCAADAGADAIGLNFYPKSPRSLDLSTARQIREAVEKRILIVGLFVNARVEDIQDVIDGAALDMVQLHGDEPPDFSAKLKDCSILRAFRTSGDSLAEIESHLVLAQDAHCVPEGVLIDGHHQGKYGGAGVVADWPEARRVKSFWQGPLILAGGLCSENVAQAIAAVRPDGVDVASGVESRPGKKDPVLVRRFVAEAQRALRGCI